MSVLPKGIGPHEERELELMLAGTKPLALLHSEPGQDWTDLGLENFAPHVEAGRIISFNVPSEDKKVIDHYFCLPGEEWRIKVLLHMNKLAFTPGSDFSYEDDDRLRGTLLGYSREEIQIFIDHSRRAR